MIVLRKHMIIKLIVLFVVTIALGPTTPIANATTENQSVSAPSLSTDADEDLPTCGNFTDVSTTNPFYEGIQFYDCRDVAHGYFGQTCTDNGVGSPCFLPNTPITRGQLAKVVVQSHDYCCYIPPGAPTFADVPANSTFYQYIETAYWYRLMEPAYCNPTCYFTPNSNSNRGEAAHALMKAPPYLPVDVVSNFFSDVTSSTPYYLDIETAYARGLATGVTGNPNYMNPCTGQYENANNTYFRPCEVITRGQVAKMDTNDRTYHSQPYPGTFNWEQNAFGINPGLRIIPSGYVDVDAYWSVGGPYHYDIHAFNLRWTTSAKQWVVDNEANGAFEAGIGFFQNCTSPSYFRGIVFSVYNSTRYFHNDCGYRFIVNNPATNNAANTPYYSYGYWSSGEPTLTLGNIKVANIQIDTFFGTNNRVDWLSGDRRDLCYHNNLGIRKCPFVSDN